MIGAGAALEFLPLETILFDSARLWRETVIDLASGAAFLDSDILISSRRARGEAFTRVFARGPAGAAGRQACLGGRAASRRRHLRHYQ
jgi:hypothetical protein